jgi:hypothetical protein
MDFTNGKNGAEKVLFQEDFDVRIPLLQEI